MPFPKKEELLSILALAGPILSGVAIFGMLANHPRSLERRIETQLEKKINGLQLLPRGPSSGNLIRRKDLDEQLCSFLSSPAQQPLLAVVGAEQNIHYQLLSSCSI